MARVAREVREVKARGQERVELRVERVATSALEAVLAQELEGPARLL